MKKQYKIASVFALLTIFLMGCSVEDISEYSTMCDPAWHLSSDKDNINPIKLAQNKYISFMDVSQGAISHKWIVPDGVGIQFIDGVMDYNTTDYSSMVIDNPYTTDKGTIHLYFTQAGDYTITLLNTYPTAVDYQYTDSDGNIQTEYSTIEDGLHVVRKEFDCHIYVAELQPAALVYSFNAVTNEYDIPVATGYEADGVTYKSVEIKYGDSLRFVDDSFEEPNFWSWYCYNADILDELGSDVTLQFKSTVSPLVVRQTVERKSSGSFVPVAAAVQQNVPLNIIITESDEAISVLQPYQVDNNTIYVELDNAIFDSSSIVSGSNGFELSYQNGANNGIISVSEVSVLSTDASILKLTLPEKVYNTDTLTLTYSGSDVKVKYNSNVFTLAGHSSVKTTLLEAINYDFEDPAQLDDWKLTYSDVSYNSLATATNFCVKEDSGDKYMYIDCSAATDDTFGSGRPAIAVCDKVFAGVQGNYTLSFNYKIISESPDWTSFGSPSCSVTPAPYTYNDGSWMTMKEFLSTNIVWTAVSVPFESTMSADDLKLFFRSGGWRGEIAIDDVKLSNAEPRP